MGNPKITFITTVFNEEQSIISFLSSIVSQSLVPSEVVIVDAYSTDNTFSLLSKFIQENKENYKNITWKVLQKKGNRSIGRNEAIHHASNEIIACSDVGCILSKSWLEKISHPFSDHAIEVVAGYYHPIAITPFQKALASYTCVMPDKLDVHNFLPSSRSIAFRKTAWERVKGYPEYLNYCEDLIFARKLKTIGMKFITVKDAIVDWPQKNNVIEAFIQFFQYATGDGEAIYIRKNIMLLYLRYFCAFVIFFLSSVYFPYYEVPIFVLLFILYACWSIEKNYRYVKSYQALYLLPILQLTADVAVLSGTTWGLIHFLQRRISDRSI